MTCVTFHKKFQIVDILMGDYWYQLVMWFFFGFGNNLKPHPQTDPVVSCYFGTVHEWLYVVSTSDDFVKVGHFWKLAFLTYFREDTQF